MSVDLETAKSAYKKSTLQIEQSAFSLFFLQKSDKQQDDKSSS